MICKVGHGLVCGWFTEHEKPFAGLLRLLLGLLGPQLHHGSSHTISIHTQSHQPSESSASSNGGQHINSTLHGLGHVVLDDTLKTKHGVAGEEEGHGDIHRDGGGGTSGSEGSGDEDSEGGGGLVHDVDGGVGVGALDLSVTSDSLVHGGRGVEKGGGRSSKWAEGLLGNDSIQVGNSG